MNICSPAIFNFIKCKFEETIRKLQNVTLYPNLLDKFEMCSKSLKLNGVLKTYGVTTSYILFIYNAMNCKY